MTNRDPRYLLVQLMHERGRLNSFKDIVDVVPRTTVARDLGMKVQRFNKLLKRVGKFELEHIAQIASFCEVDLKLIDDLWKKEFFLQKESIQSVQNKK